MGNLQSYGGRRIKLGGGELSQTGSLCKYSSRVRIHRLLARDNIERISYYILYMISYTREYTKLHYTQTDRQVIVAQ